MAYKRISPQPVIEGGTGAQTFTLDGVLIGNNTSAITATTAGTTGQILTGVTASAPTFQAHAASSITITGDTGGGLTNNAFTFTGGTTGLTFNGASTTETVQGILVVPDGGTGIGSTTAYAPICGGTTATGAFQAASTGLATAGNVLTSNGSSALPSFNPLPIPGLVFIATQTISNTTSLQFTSGISTIYDNYLILLHAVTTNADEVGNQIIIQLSTDGGSTWKSTGYTAQYGNAGPQTSEAGMMIAFLAGYNPSTVTYNSTIQLMNLTASNNYPCCWSQSHWNSTYLSYNSWIRTTIYTTQNTAVNAIRFICPANADHGGPLGNANFSAIAYLYGYVK